MSRWQTRTPTTRNAEPDGVATAYVQGYWLVLTQIVLGILALFALLVFVASLPVYAMQLQTLCRATPCAAGQLTPTAVHTLHGFGISVESYVLFRFINIVASALISFVMAGVLVWRRPHDWMALLVAFMLVMMGIVGTMNTVAVSASVWHVPAQLVSLLANSTYMLVFMVFPNGRFVPRWIPWLFIPFIVLGVWYTFFLTSFNSTSWLSLFGDLLFVGLISSLPAMQIYRYWRVSTPVERQQTKWVVYGLVLGFALGFVPFIPTYYVIPSLSQPDSLYLLVVNPDAGGSPLGILLPLSFGVAILRYRLWDIDIIINRTLVYVTLTALLALIYVGSILLLQFLLSGFTGGNSLAIVASTLTIATLFQPLRKRIQQGIDRRFYRRKYDAAKTVAAFSATLRSELDLEQLRKALLAVVEETMQPSHVSLWLPPAKPTRQQLPGWSTPPPSDGLTEE